uniref:MICOS complex subunit MIC25 n=1 Tax=Marmota marmota marmota TaxID=9994 RepID=A0A8C6A493_MARMA
MCPGEGLNVETKDGLPPSRLPACPFPGKPCVSGIESLPSPHLLAPLLGRCVSSWLSGPRSFVAVGGVAETTGVWFRGPLLSRLASGPRPQCCSARGCRAVCPVVRCCPCISCPVSLARFQQEQASIQEELFQVVTREREAAAKHLKAPPPRDSSCTDPEEPKSAQLARELESREAEQRRREAFYREQLERIGKKAERLGSLSSGQPGSPGLPCSVPRRPRRVEPVCSGLQAQILRCYRDHLSEVLCCSDLVKAYQHCVSAHKVSHPLPGGLGHGPRALTFHPGQLRPPFQEVLPCADPGAGVRP